RPTPIVAPWNGGSGFHPKDSQDGISAIEVSRSERLAPYREAIAAARSALAQLRLGEKPTDEDKTALIRVLRRTLADDALVWLDAALVMTDRPRMAPLLGTGGNDGRLEFSKNHMERLAGLFEKGADTTAALASSLFGEAALALEAGAVGQFAPAAVGG